MPEAVLSAIRSRDVRLVMKNQSCLEMAGSGRIMPQHGPDLVCEGGRALIERLFKVTFGGPLSNFEFLRCRDGPGREAGVSLVSATI